MAWKPQTPYLITDGIVEIYDNVFTVLYNKNFYLIVPEQ